MTLNAVIAFILRFFSPNSTDFQADYITVVEERFIMSVKYCLSVLVFYFWRKLSCTLQRNLFAIAEHLVFLKCYKVFDVKCNFYNSTTDKYFGSFDRSVWLIDGNYRVILFVTLRFTNALNRQHDRCVTRVESKALRLTFFAISKQTCETSAAVLLSKTDGGCETI